MCGDQGSLEEEIRENDFTRHTSFKEIVNFLEKIDDQVQKQEADDAKYEDF